MPVITDPDLDQKLDQQSSNEATPQTSVAPSSGVITDPNLDQHLDQHFSSEEPTPSEPPVPSMTGSDVMRSLTSSIPVVGPLLDKYNAAAKAIIGSGESGDTFSDRYSKNLADIQQQEQQIHQNHPIADDLLGGTGNVVTAIAGGEVPVAGKLLSGALGTVGDSVLTRMGLGAVGGGAIGGTDAALRGNSVVGGTVGGAAVGAGAPLFSAAVAPTAKMLMEKFGPGIPSPLPSDLSKTSEKMLLNAFGSETPVTTASSMNQFGPAGFVADANNPAQMLTKSIFDKPGEASDAIKQAYVDRQQQIGPGDAAWDRANSVVNQTMGPPQDLSALTRGEDVARKGVVDPLYDAWRNTPVPPTDDLRNLMPRLQAAGAVSKAENKMAIDGVPGYQQWFSQAPNAQGQMALNVENSPTAQTYDYMKRSLDDKINSAYASGEKGTARGYVNLKNDLLDAIDNHPDPNVAGVWQQGRQAWADTQSIQDARNEGYGVFDKNTDKDELREQLGNYSPPQIAAFTQGARSKVGDIMGDTIRGNSNLQNQLLTPNNQNKLSQIVGQNNADTLTQSLRQERELATSKNTVVGGSPTNRNMNANVLSGIPAAASSVKNYFANLAVDRPGSFFGLTPDHVLNAAEQNQLANARSQISPILTTPRGPNDDMVNALLNLRDMRNQQQMTANKARTLSSLLVGGFAYPQAQKSSNIPGLP